MTKAWLSIWLTLLWSPSMLQGQVRINFQSDINTEPDIVSYSLYRSITSGSGYVFIGQGTEDQPGCDCIRYFDPGVVLDGTTYYYAVTATNIVGLQSAFSNEVEVRTALPNPPQSLIIIGTQ